MSASSVLRRSFSLSESLEAERRVSRVRAGAAGLRRAAAGLRNRPSRSWPLAARGRQAKHRMPEAPMFAPSAETLDSGPPRGADYVRDACRRGERPSARGREDTGMSEPFRGPPSARPGTAGVRPRLGAPARRFRRTRAPRRRLRIPKNPSEQCSRHPEKPALPSRIRGHEDTKRAQDAGVLIRVRRPPRRHAGVSPARAAGAAWERGNPALYHSINILKINTIIRPNIIAEMWRAAHRAEPSGERSSPLHGWLGVRPRRQRRRDARGPCAVADERRRWMVDSPRDAMHNAFDIASGGRDMRVEPEIDGTGDAPATGLGAAVISARSRSLRRAETMGAAKWFIIASNPAAAPRPPPPRKAACAPTRPPPHEQRRKADARDGADRRRAV